MRDSISVSGRARARRAETLDQTSLAILSRIPLLAEVAQWPAAQVDRAITPLRQSLGGILYRQGEGGGRLYVIVSGGAIMTSSVVAGGAACIIEILRPGDCFGEEALLGVERLSTATLLPKSLLLAVDAALLPIGGQRVLNHVYGRLSALTAEVAALKSLSPAQRLARLLLSLTDATLGPAVIVLPPKHKILAGWIGVRPETFSSRVLPKLRSVGVSFDGNRIAINDVAALDDFSRGRGRE
ncbi:transcriptional regulator Crp/Fnr family [Paramagnetospirillum magnetotacticum MS-1]|uniref:Transcriptional regulator Crp/Fnr family n=1 Tax=Paramagnetospirillum magnetotacticum MS-1 TaxID=272627 RepID=A0A0C2YI56_PARME|nr:Crp/Fnr family transcriptional regulator [Paramagnetospirillum magnetotacticum]KIL99429.1 transcriptional regulator Crp/Fnr family [Paramagnetospirillum magnetotacticum MS-1]